jgi:hypothetical protein
MLRRYSCVEIDGVFDESLNGEVSVSSPTCVEAKSPFDSVLLAGPRYGWLFCGSAAGQ